MFMCVRVCEIQIEWPVIKRLNGVCCPSTLLIKLEWSGLVGTCHNQPKPHPSLTDLATAGPLNTAVGPGGSSAQELTTAITPSDQEPGWPTDAPFSFITPTLILTHWSDHYHKPKKLPEVTSKYCARLAWVLWYQLWLFGTFDPQTEN